MQLCWGVLRSLPELYDVGPLRRRPTSPRSGIELVGLDLVVGFLRLSLALGFIACLSRAILCCVACALRGTWPPPDAVTPGRMSGVRAEGCAIRIGMVPRLAGMAVAYFSSMPNLALLCGHAAAAPLRVPAADIAGRMMDVSCNAS